MDNYRYIVKQLQFCNESIKTNKNETLVKVCKFVINYYNAVGKASDNDDFLDDLMNGKLISLDKSNKMFELFFLWFEQEGSLCINNVLKNINDKKVDSRLDAFIKIYSKYVNDALCVGDLEVLFEFLYRIPIKMERDFNKFKFLEEGFEPLPYEPFLETDENEIENERFNIYFDTIEPDYCQALNILY